MSSTSPVVSDRGSATSPETNIICCISIYSVSKTHSRGLYLVLPIPFRRHLEGSRLLMAGMGEQPGIKLPVGHGPRKGDDLIFVRELDRIIVERCIGLVSSGRQSGQQA